MASIKLYHFPLSAPSRIALLSARALDVPVEIEHLDLMKKDHLSEEFLKINPQHCVPTLVDDGFTLWESRAIACYLADKYGKDDVLYPKDLEKRAVVNQRLYFDASNLYIKIRAICFPILFQGITEIAENLRNDMNVVLGVLDGFLGPDKKWLCGDEYTLADIACYCSVSSILAVGWDMSEFVNIQRWLETCKVLPGYEENQEGAEKFGEAVRQNLKTEIQM